MKKPIFRKVVLALTAFGAAWSVSVTAANPEQALLTEAQRYFKPLPKDGASKEFPTSPERVALGRTLFFDPRPSLDGTVSCAKCHQPALYGTDGLSKSIGVKDRLNPRNAPTVLNSALQVSQHWRGDRTNVEDQAKKALLGAASYGQPDFIKAMAQLEAIPGYKARFEKAFPGDAQPVNPDNWAKAIGAYERTLLSAAPFDDFLKGNTQAISPAAKAGLRSFIDTGCVSCHNGVGIGGGQLKKFGLTEAYWQATGSQGIDKGRFDVTQNEADLYVFKVPSLRNVAMTPPYFHDGSVASLADAVGVMAKVQLGKTLSSKERAGIAAFLNTLTGALPDSFATAPALPAGGFKPAN